MFDEKTVMENLEIDQFNLDDEVRKQPALYFYYAEQLANANDELARAKEALDIAESNADARIRNSPTKITEAYVKSQIVQDADVQKATEMLLDATKTRNLLDAAVKAFDQRRESLTNLVRLHATSYFAEPADAIYAKAAEQEIKQEHVKRVVRTRMNKNESNS